MTEAELPRATNRHLWWRTSWAAGIGAVVGGVLTALPIHHHPPTVLSVAAGVLTFGGYAGFFAILTRGMNSTHELRLPFVGLDRRTRRLLRRTVIGRRERVGSAPPASELRRARDFADAYRLQQPVILAQAVLVCAANLGAHALLAHSADSWDAIVRIVYLFVLPPILVVGSVLTVVRTRRATAYLNDTEPPGDTSHRDDAVAARPTPPTHPAHTS